VSRDTRAKRDDRSVLVLFDIDGTLLRTQGAGMAAMTDALSELHPDREISFDGIGVAGRLDTLIWRDLVAKHELDDSASSHDRFRACYARHLERRLDERPGSTRVMPGVPVLLEELRHAPLFQLGLLTGNYSNTGRLKIRHSGLDPDLFTVNAWAEDGESRRALPPVAMRRYQEHTGRVADPSRTIIIGDTPFDVDCARASGCRVIGVATGDFTSAVLAEHGADLALETLEETAEVLRWLRDGAV